MNGLNEIEIDGHMNGDLMFLFFPLDINLFVLLVRDGDTLTDERFELLRVADLIETVEGIRNEAVAKGTQSNLNDGPVVEDLRSDVCVCDCLLQMAQEHEITGLKEVVKDCEMVNVKKEGMCL